MLSERKSGSLAPILIGQSGSGVIGAPVEHCRRFIERFRLACCHATHSVGFIRCAASRQDKDNRKDREE